MCIDWMDVPIAFQDLDSSSDDEDFQSNRKQFQQARSISTASRKTLSFFDMEMTNKDENLRQSVPFVRQITEDGKAKLEIYRPTTNPIYIYTQVSFRIYVVRYWKRHVLKAQRSYDDKMLNLNSTT